MLKMLRTTVVGLSILLMAVFASGATITVDGDMSDWTSAMMLDVAPGIAEETGDFGDLAALDIKDLYVTNDADYVYVRIDISEDGLLTDVADGTVPGVIQFFFDSDMSNATGLTWDWWATGCDYWLRPLNSLDTVQHYIGVGGSAEDYELMGAGYTVAFNDDDNAMEIAVPRVDVGLDAIDASCSILLLFEETVNWGADAYPDDIGGVTVDYYFSSTKTINGDMSDWAIGELMDGDSLPEETGDFGDLAALDIKDVYLAYDDEYVYVRLDINEDGLYTDVVDGTVPGVVQFFFDTDLSTETGLTWDWWATGCDYWLRPLNPLDTIQHYIGVGGSAEDYELMGGGYSVAFNDDDNAMEIAVPRVDIGAVGTFYESFYFLALFEETVNWGADAFPDDIGGATALFSFGAGGTQRSIPVAIDENYDVVPTEFAMISNYPNPFNPSTTIRFNLTDASNVSLDVYNMLGQKVASLYNGAGHTGANEVTWNGMNDYNQSVDSGVYVYRLSTPNGVASGKMIMLK